MDYTIFKTRLQQLMDGRGICMKRLAEEIGSTPATVSRYLSSDRKPDLEYVVRLANYFAVTVDWLIGIDDDRTSPMSAEIRKLVELYSYASPDDKRVVSAVLQKYEANSKEQST